MLKLYIADDVLHAHKWSVMPEAFPLYTLSRALVFLSVFERAD